MLIFAWPLTLSFVFLSPLRRSRSSARRWQRSLPGSRWPLPLGRPLCSPPPRLLIRERRVPGGPAAPLPRCGLGPPRHPGTPLRRTDDAPEDGRRHRASEDGPVSHVPGCFPSPVTLYRPHHVPPDCRPSPSPWRRGPAWTGLLAASSSPAWGTWSCPGGGRPSRHLAKPPDPKKTPRLKPPGSAFSPLGPECQFSPPKLLPKHLQCGRAPPPGLASPPRSRGSTALADAFPNVPASPSRLAHLPLLFLPTNILPRCPQTPQLPDDTRLLFRRRKPCVPPVPPRSGPLPAPLPAQGTRLGVLQVIVGDVPLGFFPDRLLTDLSKPRCHLRWAEVLHDTQNSLAT